MLWKQHFLLANREKGQTSKQAGRQASRRAGEQASRQAGKQASKQTGNEKKYDTKIYKATIYQNDIKTQWLCDLGIVWTHMDCQYRPSLLNKVLAYESRSDRYRSNPAVTTAGHPILGLLGVDCSLRSGYLPNRQLRNGSTMFNAETSLTLAEGALHQETKPTPNSARSKFKFHQIPASCTSKKLSVQGFSVGNQISSTHFESLTIHTPTC